MTEDRLVNGTSELCADGGPDRCEVAAVMSDVLGRPIEAEATDIDTWLARSNLPQDDYSRNARAKMYGYYDTRGLVGNTLTLKAILGREPLTLRQFFIDLNEGAQTTAR